MKKIYSLISLLLLLSACAPGGGGRRSNSYVNVKERSIVYSGSFDEDEASTKNKIPMTEEITAFDKGNVKQYKKDAAYPDDESKYFTRRIKEDKAVYKPVYKTIPEEGKDLTSKQIDNIIKKIKKFAEEEDVTVDEEIKDLKRTYVDIVLLSKYCCSYSIANEFKKAAIPDDYIFKFLMDDIRSSELQTFCMIVSDKDINNIIKSKEISKLIKNVKRSCICKNKKILTEKTRVFNRLNKEYSFWTEYNLIYEYRNELGQTVKNNINRDVSNIIKVLENCP